MCPNISRSAGRKWGNFQLRNPPSPFLKKNGRDTSAPWRTKEAPGTSQGKSLKNENRPCLGVMEGFEVVNFQKTKT
ncbi:hypothetical protein JTE90_012592 [Oedothorax gibbosus]|uniref:Uncharacterized protein n=1 Tax=Oedothorax gibbosus TaxID=931172 RepID=A0AAV6V3W7_9ARAC|nr:hypothetical protein JTE90_012592 [Oedothorax gibbosus]